MLLVTFDERGMDEEEAAEIADEVISRLDDEGAFNEEVED